MDYLFRDMAYQGTTIRFIKPRNFDSDGFLTASGELFRIREQLKAENPDLRVVIMLGNSNTSYTQDDLMGMFFRDFPRKRDRFYDWELASTDS